MNQINIGKFIAAKRKEKNLTQEQLADKLMVSNKTVSKWERGKCMPDYSVVEALCSELDITVAELLNGASNKKDDRFNEAYVMEIIKDVEKLKNERIAIYGILLILLGMILYLLACVGNANDTITYAVLSKVCISLFAVSEIAGVATLIWTTIRARRINKK